MAIPKKVKVLSKTYSIIVDEHIWNEGTGASGLCKPWKTQIHVAKGELNEQQERDTVLHEVMHAIFSEMGLTTDFKEENEEEKIVRCMATGLLAVLRENPALVKYLTGA